MGENIGELDGVKRISMCSFSAILMITEVLCAARLSKINDNLLPGYFFLISLTNVSKYAWKVSVFVPPFEKNWMNSTPC